MKIAGFYFFYFLQGWKLPAFTFFTFLRSENCWLLLFLLFYLDGASNAIGSVHEIEVQTHQDLDNDDDLSICLAHQNDRAGGYASGTHKHALPVNTCPGSILEKSHTIQVRVNPAQSRIEVLGAIQKHHKRKPELLPKPCNEARWNAQHDEIKHASIIMADLCLAIQQLLGHNGDDCEPLFVDEKESE